MPACQKWNVQHGLPASEFIGRMENKFESQVEERGTNFSGGQNNGCPLPVGLSAIPVIPDF